MLAIADRTSSDQYLWRLDGLAWQGARPEDVEISPSTLDDYKAKNITTSQLERSFDLEISYVLVGAAWAVLAGGQASWVWRLPRRRAYR